MSRKRQRSPEERRLLQAREADRVLRKERANRLGQRSRRVRKLRSQTGWAFYRVGVISLWLVRIPRAFQWAAAVSGCFAVLYVLLDLYFYRLEREREFYGWVPDTRVIPPDWKRM